jgi:hypothetical protein
LSNQAELGMLDITQETAWQLEAARWLLPVGWGLTAIGFLGPWVAHSTSALALSGADMAEFVKFLPGVLDGAIPLVRQWFYLPPVAIAASIALLIGSRPLRYTGLLQALALLLGFAVSVQLLPPAWSPSSLMTTEFRAQVLGLGATWLLLAGFWLLRRLPFWLLGSLSAGFCVIALALSLWQFLIAKPAIDLAYNAAPDTGWGLFVCLVGLAAAAAASGLALTTRSWARARQIGS